MPRPETREQARSCRNHLGDCPSPAIALHAPHQTKNGPTACRTPSALRSSLAGTVMSAAVTSFDREPSGKLSAASSTALRWSPSTPPRRSRIGCEHRHWKHFFRCWDQGLIYLLIAGTYTPIAVTFLHGGWHVITVLMWIFAIAGFLSKVALRHRIDGITLWLYLAMGWMPILGLPHLLVVAPSGVFRC